ncbi:MAG: hypothetical protein OEL20_05325 [Sulfuritalea sp.]|nr:hypothetical protein [Sulfuritalea sp.]
MLQIILRQGTADSAPTVLPRGLSTPVWSGKRDTEITPEDAASMLDYTEREAELAGWWDTLETGELTAVTHRNPFHPAFLGGLLHRLWDSHYRNGVAQAQVGEARNRRAPAPDSVGWFA